MESITIVRRGGLGMNSHFRFDLATLAVAAFLCMSPIPAVCQQTSASATQTAAKDTKSSPPTPRLADGHPDLNGFWVGGGGDAAVGGFGFGGSIVLKHGDNVEIRVGDNNNGHIRVDKNGNEIAVQRVDPNPPPYKPELMAKVKELQKNQTSRDPAFSCKPAGVPRVGSPHAIVQTPGMPVIFLYQVLAGNTYRLIPMDGRPHDPDADPSYYGESIGHWEGDTLVVDTVNFNDDTWLGEPGYFHSTALHVIERISRDGDTLHYQATVEDPTVFTRPWVMNPRTVKLTNEHTIENPPCSDRDAAVIADENRH
jgi:hypothetical protein